MNVPPNMKIFSLTVPHDGKVYGLEILAKDFPEAIEWAKRLGLPHERETDVGESIANIEKTPDGLMTTWSNDGLDSEGNPITSLESTLRKCVEALKGIVDRWDTPNWKDVPHTANFINAGRKALSEAEKYLGDNHAH